MDEVYEIGQFLAEFDYESAEFGCSGCVCVFLRSLNMNTAEFGCSGCVCVFSCLVCMKIFMRSFIKLGCIRCSCSMRENILNFALSPLCLVYMKFLVLSVIKLGCKRCIDWKR